jgi:hypothetical protein
MMFLLKGKGFTAISVAGPAYFVNAGPGSGSRSGPESRSKVLMTKNKKKFTTEIKYIIFIKNCNLLIHRPW